MNALTSCPLCKEPASPSYNEYRCQNCDTIFSVIRENAILVESVGFRPQKGFIVLSD